MRQNDTGTDDPNEESYDENDDVGCFYPCSPGDSFARLAIEDNEPDEPCDWDEPDEDEPRIFPCITQAAHSGSQRRDEQAEADG